MSMFIEVDSVDKGCPVILNLDQVVEIAPLAVGGCAVFTNDGGGVNSKNAMRVKNDYSEFKQFVLQTVSAEDIARRFPKPESARPVFVDEAPIVQDRHDVKEHVEKEVKAKEAPKAPVKPKAPPVKP